MYDSPLFHRIAKHQTASIKPVAKVRSNLILARAAKELASWLVSLNKVTNICTNLTQDTHALTFIIKLSLHNVRNVFVREV